MGASVEASLMESLAIAITLYPPLEACNFEACPLRADHRRIGSGSVTSRALTARGDPPRVLIGSIRASLPEPRVVRPYKADSWLFAIPRRLRDSSASINPGEGNKKTATHTGVVLTEGLSGD